MMRNSKRLMVLAIMMMALAAAEARAQLQPQPVQATLIADVDRLTGGESFRLGVLFDIAPQWHIYWQNPGDSGVPTMIQFDLPAGFTHSPLHWPAPRQFQEPGDLTTFGYERRVLLWTTVTVPEGFDADGPITLKARADWLACQRECIIGKADLELTLPNGAAGRSAIFEEWQATLPVPIDHADSPARASGRTEIRPDAIVFSHRVDWREPVSEVRLFPGSFDNLIIQGKELVHHQDHSHVEVNWYRAGPLMGEAPPPIPVVLTYRRGDGRRGAVELSVPLME